MPSDGSLEIQTAVYNALVAAASPPIAGGRIGDHTEASSAFPFIRIADIIGVPSSIDGFHGATHIVQVEVYSQYKGMKEIHELTTIIYNALHETNLTIATRPSALCFHENTKVQRDPTDGVTHQAIMGFRIESFEAE